MVQEWKHKEKKTGTERMTNGTWEGSNVAEGSEPFSLICMSAVGSRKAKMASQRDCENGAVPRCRVLNPILSFFFTSSTIGVSPAEYTSEDGWENHRMHVSTLKTKRRKAFNTRLNFLRLFLKRPDRLTDWQTDRPSAVVNTHTLSSIVCWIYKNSRLSPRHWTS